MRKAIAGVVAGFLTSVAPVAAQTPAQEQAFEAALAAHDISTASTHLDRLITERLPANGKAKPDPYLNHRIGRLLMASNHPRAALPWLEAADDAKAPAADRARIALDRATALLALGQTAEALALLDTVSKDLGDASNRSVAQRLRIEGLLVSDPAAARNALAAAAAFRARDTANEWDWALLDAQAALLTNNQTASAKALSAWSSAIAAPLQAAAPARAAAMMAMVEERAGNRAGALAMLAAAARSEIDIAKISTKLTIALPACGAAITPQDQVTVALHGGSHGGTRISAIAASRPEIVPNFLTGLSGVDLTNGANLATGATIARLRCRVAPYPEAMSRTAERDPAAIFMARHGLFPRFRDQGTEEEQLNSVSREVDDLSARFGAENPLLLGPLLSLVHLSQSRVAESGDVAPTRLIELIARLERVLRAAGDTGAFLPPEHNYFSAFARAVNAPSREAGRQIMDNSFRAYARNVDFDIAYDNVIGTGEGIDPAQLDSMRAELIERGIKARPPGDPRIAALRLTRVGAARKADNGTLMARVRETGLPRDLCTLQDVTPRMRSNDMTDDDYPAEGLIAALTGRTSIEFDLDSEGQLKAPRTIVSVPPILFDPVVAKHISGFSYFPAEAGAKPVACRAMLQAVRWKMPDRDEDGPARMMPEKWIPGS